MRELKTNRRHRRADPKSQFRLIVAVLFLVGIMILFWYNLKEYRESEIQNEPDLKEYLPVAKKGKVYHKPSYSLSYVEKYEIPEWVAYRLTVEMMNRKKYPRNQDFNPDPEIAEGSAHYHDYKQSGYRRGHLVPSADMAWDKKSMDATFLLSNIAPMLEEFNDGIWLELEHNVRDWSRKYKDIFIIAGPVFNDSIKTIGNNEVLVPRYYYKAIFTLTENKPLVIGFLFDQTTPDPLRLENYVVPVDSIEKLTGLDLFENLYGSWDTEILLEKQDSISANEWPINDKWYAERMDNQQLK